MAEKRKDDKGRILRTGETQRKQDGRYCYNYTDLTGNRKRVYALTLQELRVKEKEIQRDLDNHIDSSKADITLNALFYAYMDTKTNLRDTTRCNYKSVWKSGIEDTVLGNMKISQIKQIHIKKFYAELVKQGMAEKTIKFYQSLIYPALELAVNSDMIYKNPAKGCGKNTGGTKGKKTAMTANEETRLLEFLKGENIYSVYRPMIHFALLTGLRIGELTGLRWHDIDTKANAIHVRQQLIYKNLGDGCQFYIQDLKTEAGKRDIPMTEAIKECLAKQREYYRLTGNAFSQFEVDGIKDFVFINSKGKPYTTAAFNFILKNIVKAYNKAECNRAEKEHREPEQLPHISAHILRHTACSRLAEAGLEPKVLQYIMGHANISVTMDIYTHLDFSQIREKTETAQKKIG